MVASTPKRYAMKTERLQNWIQIGGMVGVVASLVFVGLQLKQSQDIAIAAQYQARLEAASTHYTAMLQSEPALRVIGNDLLADLATKKESIPEIYAWAASQPVEELAFRVITAIIGLKSHDNVFFQYQAGFLSEEAWIALRAQLKANLSDPMNWSRGVYEENRSVWRESYQELIEELIRETEQATQ